MSQNSSGRSRGESTSMRTKPRALSTRCGRARNAALTSSDFPLATTKRLRTMNTADQRDIIAVASDADARQLAVRYFAALAVVGERARRARARRRLAAPHSRALCA